MTGLASRLFPEMCSIGPTGLQVTRLGFGTSKLFRLHSSTSRQRLLEAAYDVGIRHFDTARSYGLGEAETELGRFLRRHPDATVATKFGVGITMSGRWMRPVQGLARRIVEMVPGSRRLLRRTGTPLVAPRAFSIAEARASIDASRLALGVDRISLLFLHEPNEQSNIPSDLIDLFVELVDKGWITTWGLSGSLPDLLAVRARHPDLARVLQYQCDALNRGRLPLPDETPAVVYGPFANAIDTLKLWLGNKGPRDEWHDQIGEAADRMTIARLLIAEAVALPNRSPVVFSTTSIPHLHALADAAADQELRTKAIHMRDWIARRLGDSVITNR